MQGWAPGRAAHAPGCAATPCHPPQPPACLPCTHHGLKEGGVDDKGGEHEDAGGEPRQHEDHKQHGGGALVLGVPRHLARAGGVRRGRVGWGANMQAPVAQPAPIASRHAPCRAAHPAPPVSRTLAASKKMSLDSWHTSTMTPTRVRLGCGGKEGGTQGVMRASTGRPGASTHPTHTHAHTPSRNKNQAIYHPTTTSPPATHFR